MVAEGPFAQVGPEQTQSQEAVVRHTDLLTHASDYAPRTPSISQLNVDRSGCLLNIIVSGGLYIVENGQYVV